MEIELEDEDLIKLYQGEKTPKGLQPSIGKSFLKAIRLLEATTRIEDLYKISSLNFKALSVNKKGFFSIRVNDQYRLEFKYRIEEQITIITICKMSNHYS